MQLQLPLNYVCSRANIRYPFTAPRLVHAVIDDSRRAKYGFDAELALYVAQVAGHLFEGKRRTRQLQEPRYVQPLASCCSDTQFSVQRVRLVLLWTKKDTFTNQCR